MNKFYWFLLGIILTFIVCRYFYLEGYINGMEDMIDKLYFEEEIYFEEEQEGSV